VIKQLTANKIVECDEIHKENRTLNAETNNLDSFARFLSGGEKLELLKGAREQQVGYSNTQLESGIGRRKSCSDKRRAEELSKQIRVCRCYALEAVDC
jgi:hypothetical protein